MIQTNAMETSYLSAINIVAIQDIVNNRNNKCQNPTKITCFARFRQNSKLNQKAKKSDTQPMLRLEILYLLRRQKFYFGSKTTENTAWAASIYDEKLSFFKMLKRHFHTFARSLNSDLRSSQRGSEPQHLNNAHPTSDQFNCWLWYSLLHLE